MPDSNGAGASDSSRGSVFLTGATGFIGSRVQDRLIADGWRVRVLARPASSRSAHLHPAAEVIAGSLADSAALGRGLAGATAVVNCAGSVRGASFADFEAANVAGVRALCESVARLSTQPAILHLSSLAAEAPELSHYARSKREGERVLQAFDALCWTVIRPPAVYGPGEKEMRGALALARRGLVPVPGGDRRQRLSMLHVDDLADAVLAWLKTPTAHRHRTYSIHDGAADGYDWNDIAAAVCRRRPLFVGLPAGLLDVFAGANERLARLTGRPVMLSRGKVRELTHPRWVADNASFSRASGWTPRISLAEGVSGLFES